MIEVMIIDLLMMLITGAIKEKKERDIHNIDFEVHNFFLWNNF